METGQEPDWMNGAVSDEEMAEAMKHGEKMFVNNDEYVLTVYLYNDRVYVHDINDLENA